MKRFSMLTMAGPLQRSRMGGKQLRLQLQGLQEELRQELQVNHQLPGFLSKEL